MVWAGASGGDVAVVVQLAVRSCCATTSLLLGLGRRCSVLGFAPGQAEYEPGADRGDPRVGVAGLGLGCLRGRAVTGAVFDGGGLALLPGLLIDALTSDLASCELQVGLPAAVGSPRIVSPSSRRD